MLHVNIKKSWRMVAALSPLLAGLAATCAPASTPIPEESGSSVGYPTVAAALQGLRAQRDITFTEQHGWTIAIDEAERTIWSFAPRNYPAYPAVVRRHVVPEGRGSRIEMKVLCEATKAACDDLVRTFAQMNGMPLPS